MAWARITRDFDWKVPGKRAFKSFSAGNDVPVTHTQLADIKAAGAGHEIRRPAGLKTTKAGKRVSVNG